MPCSTMLGIVTFQRNDLGLAPLTRWSVNTEDPPQRRQKKLSDGLRLLTYTQWISFYDIDSVASNMGPLSRWDVSFNTFLLSIPALIASLWYIRVNRIVPDPYLVSSHHTASFIAFSLIELSRMKSFMSLKHRRTAREILLIGIPRSQHLLDCKLPATNG